MTPKVFDVHGQEQSMQWLQNKYHGVEFKDGGSGTKFALTQINEQRDLISIFVTVLNEYGAPHVGQPVANYWPDPTLQDLTGDPNLKTLWKDRAHIQRTSVAGIAEWNFGGGSVIKEQGGPHWLWVLSPTFPSDGLANVGWLGSTNHWGPLRLTFQITAPKALNWWRRFLLWLKGIFS